MPAQTFPTDIYYKHIDQTHPQSLEAGHFLERNDVYELVDASTTPDVEVGIGGDFLLIGVGTSFNVNERKTGWMVQLLTEEGDIITLHSKEAIFDDNIRVTPSRQPM